MCDGFWPVVKAMSVCYVVSRFFLLCQGRFCGKPINAQWVMSRPEAALQIFSANGTLDRTFDVKGTLISKWNF